jgi:hypothetical protein
MTVAYRAPSHPGMGYPAFVDPKPPRRYDAPTDDVGPSAPHSPEPSVFPRLDDHLVRPETREEMIDGRLVLAPPALEPHAERHFELDYVTRGGAAPGYVGATDLLTRTGARTQFAADTCIRREGIDPATGTRYLEELAFEIVNEQSLADVTKRARDLTTRGVRRIIAIFVKTNDVRDWSPSLDDWITFDPNGAIEDRTLAMPLPVRALLDRAAANRAVVQGLKAKGDPAIREIEDEGRRKGLQEGRAQMARTAIEGLCEILEIPFGPERQALLHTLDAAKLEALYAQIRAQRRWA